MAVDGDGAVCHVVKAEEEFERCGLSAARFADDGGLCTGCDGEVDAIEDGAALLGLVGEFDVVEGDFALGGGQVLGVGLLDYTGCFLELWKVSNCILISVSDNLQYQGVAQLR